MIAAYLGEIAALTGAFFWASASTIYSLLGAKIAPLTLNLSKGLIAIALIIITLWLKNNLVYDLGYLTIVWLLISGAIGIGFGDTAYFSALNNLGARRTLLLETLAPPLAGCLAWLFLGESLSIQAWSGIFLTILGVAWVISERTAVEVISPQQGKIGVLWGVLAAIAQAVGAVMARYALVESQITPLYSALIRLIGGVLIILPLFIISLPKSRVTPSSIWSFKLVGIIVLTAFISTYLGIWLQQTAIQSTRTGIALTLLATSPLFILPIVKIMGETISFRAIFGCVIAIVGIAILFFNY